MYCMKAVKVVLLSIAGVVGLIFVAAVITVILGGGEDTTTATPAPTVTETTPPAPEPSPSDTPTPSPSPTPTAVTTATPTPTPTASPTPPAPPPPPPVPPSLWKTDDGKATIRCEAPNELQEIQFGLPPKSPIDKELNAILAKVDGRKPATVLTVREIDHASYPKLDEADYFQTLTLQLPGGTIKLDRVDDNAFYVLHDLYSLDLDKKLRDRIKALQNEIRKGETTWDKKGEERLYSTKYLVTEEKITRIVTANARFRGEGPDCTVR